MEIKEVPYFCFEVNAWEAPTRSIKLNEGVEDLTKKILNGEKLVKTIPSFGRLLGRYELFSAHFATREEIVNEDKTYVCDEGFRKVGKIWIPEYNIKNRNELTGDFALTRFPSAKTFYMSQVKDIYTPFEEADFHRLKKEQIR